MRRRCCDTTWETDATTVGGHGHRGARTSAGSRRAIVTIGDYEFEVERVADRAVESVIVARVPTPAATRTSHDRGPRPHRDHPAARPRQRPVRRRRVRHRRRAAGEHRAPGGAGQPAGPQCAARFSKIRSCRIATSRRRRSASRSRASGSACTASTGWPTGSRRGSSRSTTTGWIAAHTRRQRHRRRHPHLPAHRHRRDGAEGAGAAARAEDGALRLAGHRALERACCRWSSR